MHSKWLRAAVECGSRDWCWRGVVGVGVLLQVVMPRWMMTTLGITDAHATAAQRSGGSGLDHLPRVCVERVEVDSLFQVCVCVCVCVCVWAMRWL